MAPERLLIDRCRFHRSGCGGAGYYAVSLAWSCDGARYQGTAIVFEFQDCHAQMQGCIAILDQNDDIWRYEDFAESLLAFINSDVGQAMAFA